MQSLLRISIVLFMVATLATAQTFEPCTTEGAQICRVGGWQICAHHDHSGLTFGLVLPCGAGTTCFPASNGGILCRPISDLLECPFNARRCFSTTAFQVCTSFPRGTVWGAPQECPAGETCQNGECFTPPPPPLGSCTSGHMQCATATTFRTCVHYAFGVAQPCPAGTECKQVGDFISCQRGGLIV